MNNPILVVDDSKHVQRQIEIFLIPEGFSRLFFVNSAQEAFHLLGLDDENSKK